MSASLLLLLAGSLGCRPAERPVLPVGAVERGAFVAELLLEGELEAVRAIPVVVPDIGTGAQVTWLADEGARVAAGDLVARLDRSELQRRLIQARNEQELAQVRIKQQQTQLGLRLADLQAAVERAELALKGAQMRVTDSESVPRVERDAARLEVQSATLARDQAAGSLETARQQGEAQLELLGIQARQGRELLERTQAQIEATELKAPASGVVLRADAPEGRPVGQGFLVFPGSHVLRIADPSELRAVLFTPEADAGALAPGQPVSLQLEALPGVEVAGEVLELADVALQERGAGEGRSLRTLVAFAPAGAVLKPGMTVRARVEPEHLGGVLSVPREALFPRGTRTCVFLESDGGWRPVEVEPGASNGTRVVVAGALEPGQRVALVDPEAEGDGAGP